MASSLLSSLTSRFAPLSNLFFAKGRGGGCSINYIRCYQSSLKIRYISLYHQFRPPRLSFSSIAVAHGGSIRSLNREDLVVLGIETSCDDTAAAVVSYPRGFWEILFHLICFLLISYWASDSRFFWCCDFFPSLILSVCWINLGSGKWGNTRPDCIIASKFSSFFFFHYSNEFFRGNQLLETLVTVELLFSLLFCNWSSFNQYLTS